MSMLLELKFLVCGSMFRPDFNFILDQILMIESGRFLPVG